ncbi:MAG TPA: hypothetical protein VFS08_12195 [Gemmatimonadaceae bacterium]|nr:hypothetical protein [Gemmatimonadaceae bacterium]
MTGRSRRRVVTALLATAALLGAGGAAPARAQVAPDADWRTLRTEHFRVHFTPELEPLARRTAGNAERAYAQLAAELHEPRGPIDLVLSDDVDFTNGSATTFPSNRIVIYASPPADQASLRTYDEWNTLVVTHELTHIFHLDRTRGWWRLGQYVFGRSPFLFPNQYLPGWVTEGIAVYYESHLTGSGRVAGSYHRTLARAAALGGTVPAVTELSLASTRFPGGDAAYGYGGLFIDYLARTRGEARVGAFIETVAHAPVPFFLNRDARRSFGISFARAWREWRDSLRRDVAGVRGDRSAFAALTGDLWQAQGPRWLGDSQLVVGLSTGREVPGAYAVGLDGRVTRLGRRNEATPNSPAPGGALVYAQLDFVDPYHVRSDLYRTRDGETTRLTTGARLSRPDVRADGEIVAMRTVPGATELVLVSPDGARVRRLTAPSLDEHWSEPRWSPDGTRIAAVRWHVGGISEVAVLDTTGAVHEVVARAHAVHASPAWTPDGTAIVYASDSSGRSQLYRVALRGDGSDPTTARPEPLSDAATGLYFPAVSPDGARLAAVRLAAAGFEVVEGEVADAHRRGVRAAGERDGRGFLDRPAVPALPPAEPFGGEARPYSPWPGLVPRYWMPVTRPGQGGAGLGTDVFLGAATSGRDVVGRHAYSADVYVGTGTGLREYDAAYAYAGLGNPVLGLSYSQEWTRRALPSQLGPGELRQRDRVAALSATLSRPRVRSNAWVALGTELEWRDYRTDPAPALAQLNPIFRTSPSYPALQLSAGFGNAQRPVRAISPEDGVMLSATVRQRWLEHDVRPFTRSAVGIASVYRSLPALPGFAHHVLAARVAGGWADDAATSQFEVGGVSGGSFEVLPGIVLGEGARTFGVRGVPPAASIGTRAVAATVEYRAPLLAPGTGIGRLPLFLDRASLVLFGETGAAWCPVEAADRPACFRTTTEPEWLSSFGGEVDADVAVQYDTVYRFRFGLALPRENAVLGVSGGVRPYVAVGRAF